MSDINIQKIYEECFPRLEKLIGEHIYVRTNTPHIVADSFYIHPPLGKKSFYITPPNGDVFEIKQQYSGSINVIVLVDLDGGHIGTLLRTPENILDESLILM